MQPCSWCGRANPAHAALCIHSHGRARPSSTGSFRALTVALGACALVALVAIGVALGLASRSSRRAPAPANSEPRPLVSAPAPRTPAAPRPAPETGPAAHPLPAPATGASPARRAPAAAPSARPAAAVDEVETTVYVTRTGEKYHREGCRYLSRSKIPTTLAAARRGYGPCSVCAPHR